MDISETLLFGLNSDTPASKLAAQHKNLNLNNRIFPIMAYANHVQKPGYGALVAALLLTLNSTSMIDIIKNIDHEKFINYGSDIKSDFCIYVKFFKNIIRFENSDNSKSTNSFAKSCWLTSANISLETYNKVVNKFKELNNFFGGDISSEEYDDLEISRMVIAGSLHYLAENSNKANPPLFSYVYQNEDNLKISKFESLVSYGKHHLIILYNEDTTTGVTSVDVDDIAALAEINPLLLVKDISNKIEGPCIRSYQKLSLIGSAMSKTTSINKTPTADEKKHLANKIQKKRDIIDKLVPICYFINKHNLGTAIADEKRLILEINLADFKCTIEDVNLEEVFAAFEKAKKSNLSNRTKELKQLILRKEGAISKTYYLENDFIYKQGDRLGLDLSFKDIENINQEIKDTVIEHSINRIHNINQRLNKIGATELVTINRQFNNASFLFINQVFKLYSINDDIIELENYITKLEQMVNQQT